MRIDEIFKKCEALTISKRHDYTSTLDNHENFKRSAIIASWFVSEEDKPYVILIGTKLARLASLLVVGKKPNNESIEDTFLDLINYCALWMEYRSVKCTCYLENVNNTIPVILCDKHKFIINNVQLPNIVQDPRD